jgi:hypothetical protein
MARVAHSVVSMSAKKTAWHPPFTGLLRERCPRWAKITGEVQLTTEPLRVDDVIEVWADDAHDPTDTGATLREMWRYVVVVALLEYKSIAWPFRHGDLGRLLACGLLWRTTHQRRVAQPDRTRTERLAAHEVTLVLAVPSRNAALDDELADHESTSGYHLVKGFPLPLLMIDLGVVAEREDDDLLGWFAGRAPQTVDARRWVRPGMAGLLLLAVTATMVTSLNHLYFDPAYARDDYRGIAQYLRDRQVPSDAVIVIAPNQMEAFGYYYGDQPGDVTVAPLPTTRPLGVEQTRAQLEDLLETHDRLWVLFWAQQQADPDGLVERWLADNAYATGDRWFGAVRLASYGTAPTGAREPSGALFGDDIALVDSALSGNRAAPGDVISVSLRWQAARVPTADYKVFIHLAISPDVPPVAQHDSTPANGFAPTSGWAANITVDDHHGLQLPADLAPGTYQLLVGLTDPQGTRLMVDGANAVGQDRVSIGTITVP